MEVPFHSEQKTIFAAWQQLPSSQITIAMASLGFSWIVVDLEHSSISINEAELIFIAAERHNCKPFVRLPSADPYLARRLLDIGAVGIIIPVVEARDVFDEFAQHCFFPPKGKRGVGLVRANNWGTHFEKYFYDFNPIIIAQIETLKGEKNITSILQSPFINGIMIGPYDLSADLQIPGKFDDPKFCSICDNIFKETRKHNKLIGYHQVNPNNEELKMKISIGYDFIVYSTDIIAMRHGLQGIKV
ncbi:HpcH/HpaI aldolase family protein [Fluviispira multicolorata]|uniref:HpcH/HpaI aldolase/citrate lyase domain-containing protein n=1 Tax=Fluviispira multicolorata TaxID=2654512 RepID=A0A833N389_9BACT|nr:aldolase/citrate lyase family protein [Fluviispira multicolorata]KAB8028029.1 hypothetical protein GCL57_13325 [Fluviispira multicolorata]